MIKEFEDAPLVESKILDKLITNKPGTCQEQGGMDEQGMP